MLPRALYMPRPSASENQRKREMAACGTTELRLTRGKLLLCAVAMTIFIHGPAAQAISCARVATYMSPCMTYVTFGGLLPLSCCAGVRALAAAAGTAADRQQACSCLKSAASTIAGFQPVYADEIPRRCGISVPYQINPSVECSK